MRYPDLPALCEAAKQAGATHVTISNVSNGGFWKVGEDGRPTHVAHYSFEPDLWAWSLSPWGFNAAGPRALNSQFQPMGHAEAAMTDLFERVREHLYVTYQAPLPDGSKPVPLDWFMCPLCGQGESWWNKPKAAREHHMRRHERGGLVRPVPDTDPLRWAYTDTGLVQRDRWTATARGYESAESPWRVHPGTVQLFITGPGMTFEPCSWAEYDRARSVGTIYERILASLAVESLNRESRGVVAPATGPIAVRRALAQAAQTPEAKRALGC